MFQSQILSLLSVFLLLSTSVTAIVCNSNIAISLDPYFDDSYSTDSVYTAVGDPGFSSRIKKRSPLSCGVSEDCISLGGLPYCLDEDFNIYNELGTSGNLLTGDYTLASGEKNNLYSSSYPGSGDEPTIATTPMKATGSKSESEAENSFSPKTVEASATDIPTLTATVVEEVQTTTTGEEMETNTATATTDEEFGTKTARTKTAGTKTAGTNTSMATATSGGYPVKGTTLIVTESTVLASETSERPDNGFMQGTGAPSAGVAAVGGGPGSGLMRLVAAVLAGGVALV